MYLLTYRQKLALEPSLTTNFWVKQTAIYYRIIYCIYSSNNKDEMIASLLPLAKLFTGFI